MKNRLVDLLILVFVFVIISCSKEGSSEISDKKEEKNEGLTYDEAVLNDKPIGYWLLKEADEQDATGHAHHGTFKGLKSPATTLPNGDTAPVFNGENSYFEIPDSDHLEVTATGILMVEAWIRPDVLDFPKTELDKDYIHWMGKGEPGEHSWAARMYNKNSWREGRPQRISGYAFNLEGGLGAGSYFEDEIPSGTWIHFVLIINTKKTSSKYPTGYTMLYRDGELRDQDDLESYDVIPGNGSAPIRIATRDLKSFFKGSIGKVALYDRELSKEEIKNHYHIMMDTN